MIDLIKMTSDHVLGVRVAGDISSRDVSLGMSFIDEKIRTRQDIALYLEVDDLSGVEKGAIMTEVRHSVSQIKDLSHIKRIAVVTDREEEHRGFAAEDLVPMIDVKIFSTTEREQAKVWAAALFAE